MSEKVYCMSCLFLYTIPEGASSFYPFRNDCHHPDNTRTMPMLGSWFTDICADRTILHPSTRNSDNDCEWFVDQREAVGQIYLGKDVFFVYAKHFEELYPWNAVGYQTFSHAGHDLFLSPSLNPDQIVLHTMNGRLMARRTVALEGLGIDVLAGHIDDMLSECSATIKDSTK